MTDSYDVDPVAGTGATRYEGAGGGDEQIHAARADYPKGEVSSVGEVISDISADLSKLIRQELDLAKAEVKESATNAGKGAGFLAGAGVAGHMALLFLSIALWWAIGSALDNLGWSALIVALIWAVIAAVLAVMGRARMKNINGVPRTVATVKAVPDALKGNEEQA